MGGGVEMEIPLKPATREEISKLESSLLVGTLLKEDILQKIRESADKLTWIDSLAVAAGALAREKAGMPVTQIAEELGRTEQTIRNHLHEKTEAGKLVRETYEYFAKGGEIKFELGEASKLREENQKLKNILRQIAELVKEIE